MGRVRVEAHIGDGWDGGEFEEFEHPVDGVHSAVDLMSFGHEGPAEFASVGKANASRGAGCAGEESGAEESLGVDDEVVVCCLNPARKSRVGRVFRRRRPSPSALRAKGTTFDSAG